MEIGINYGATKTITTGPQANFTPNGDKFIYTEASYGKVGDTALFSFPCIDLAGINSGSLRFMYHKYGADMGDLYIDVLSNGVWSYGIDSILGETQSFHRQAWKEKIVNLTPFVNGEIQLQFRAIRGAGERGDMAIDDIEITDSFIVGIRNTLSLEKEKKSFILFPNPNHGKFNLRVSNSFIGEKFLISNLQGKAIRVSTILSEETRLDLSNLKKGVYFIRLLSNGETKKVVIL